MKARTLAGDHPQAGHPLCWPCWPPCTILPAAAHSTHACGAHITWWGSTPVASGQRRPRAHAECMPTLLSSLCCPASSEEQGTCVCGSTRRLNAGSTGQGHEGAGSRTAPIWQAMWPCLAPLMQPGHAYTWHGLWAKQAEQRGSVGF